MRRLLLAMIFLSPAMLFAAAAEAKFILCYKGKETIRYAMLYEVGFIPFASKWRIEGWQTMSPGCRRIATEDTRQQIFFSMQTLSPGGEASLNVYPLIEEGRPIPEPPFAVGAERFYCVQESSFGRTLEKIERHENCPAGWYQQLFNLQIHVPPNTEYTLTLR